jgi:hypothetical protein
MSEEGHDNPEMADRKARAAKIIDNPGSYKVCEGCESIVLKKVVICPNCTGYRFDEGADRVKQQAGILGSRPSISLSSKDFE